MDTNKTEELEPAEFLPDGTILHRRYRIDGVLTRGAYGVTYEARDEKQNQRLIIKEYFPRALADRVPDHLSVSPKNKACGALFFLGSEMFYRQHLALTDAKGSCNVVSVYSAFFENGTSYAVMERLEGVPLETYLQLRKRRLTPEEAMFIAASLADALLVVHSLNSLHYGIDAQSIFLCTDGSVKLIDFGAAKAGLRARHELDDTEPWLDLDALARTLYEALTGRPVVSNEMPPNPNIPAPFYNLLLRMADPDGARRFSSVFEYRHALACIDIGADCPAVSREEALAAAPAPKQPEPQIRPQPQQRPTFLDRTLETLEKAVQSDVPVSKGETPDRQMHRQRITRRVILLYVGIAVVTLTVALIIRFVA